MTQLLYLVHREALSSVFSSQVLTPLEEHRRTIDVTLGLLTPIGHLLRSQYRPALKQIEERCRAAGIRVAWIPSPPARFPRLWSESFVLRQWIKKHFHRDQPLLVRCRNATTTSIALDALSGFQGARVIFDCRGAEATEATQRLGIEGQPESTWSPAARKSLQKVLQDEQRAVQQSAGVTCVSQAMVDLLRNTYPGQPTDKFFVVPCCPDTESFSAVTGERDKVRAELGLTDKLVVSYVGSLVWYQLPEASFRIFQQIKSLRPDAHFFAITTQPDKMREFAQAAGLSPSDFTIRSVPAREVPRLLVASDLGLMLRDDSLTNRVASPVKFGEYIAAGVPVIISERLGDYTKAVCEHDLGVEVRLGESDLQLTQRLQEPLSQSADAVTQRKERCRQYANTELSWKSLIPQLTHWYQSLLDQPLSPLTDCSHDHVEVVK